MKEKLAFLQSTRFWKVVIAVVLFALVQIGVIDGVAAESIANSLTVILGFSVGIRTVDRFSENVGK